MVDKNPAPHNETPAVKASWKMKPKHTHGPQCAHDDHTGHEHAANHEHSHDNHSHAGHGHHHHNHSMEKLESVTKAFVIGIVLNLMFVGVEAIYGIVSGSTALLSDAGHNLSDVLGLGLALGANLLSRRASTLTFTFGLRRASILAALSNATLLLLAMAVIVWEAIVRLQNPVPVAGGTVMIVAGIGIAVNGITAALFFAGRKDDLNVKGAFMHLMADALVSLGVVIAGLAIQQTGWMWLDPVTTLIISAIVVYGTWGLLKDSVTLALDGVPRGIDPAKVRSYLLSLPGVFDVHDMHIWGLSTTDTALAAHVNVQEGQDPSVVIQKANEGLRKKFKIGHTTLQIESTHAEACPQHNCDP